jgi:hypothetical protein
VARPLGGAGRPRAAARTNGRAHATISLGSCRRLRLVRPLNWANGRGASWLGCVAFPVIPRCFPPDLVRLWCRANGSSSSWVPPDLP